jgi:pimeloyl-ACP methyl ester carboxylesterase
MLAAILMVGSLTLHSCAGAPGYYCGTLMRPLDPAGRVPGSIGIGFTWKPHRLRRTSEGTIVAAEGGPGYASGRSRDAYARLFGPLLETHDLLLMDDRGTGRSGAIDCKALQGVAAISLDGVTQCGLQLGPRADLYGTALAADDLDALMARLHVAKADFYGDSYGTFFAQVFAGRHPSRVRSLALDGAYPAIGGEPWYAGTASAIRHAFDLACRRAPACASLPGSALDRIGRLLDELRQTDAPPITVAQLAFVMDSAGLDPLVFRELDAAARAYLNFGDDVALRRLAAEAAEYEEKAPADPREESNGLFAAASCSDTPPPNDMRLGPRARQAAWQRALTEKKTFDPNLYAPFSIDEFLSIPLDYAYVPLCQTWPVASNDRPAGQPLAPGTQMPSVPTLVLTGDLDTITTPSEGDATAALFTGARRVIVANTGHVSAIGDPYDCASAIVRGFIAGRRFDPSCAAAVPALRLIPAFAQYVAQVPAAQQTGEGDETDADLRAAADAAYAAGDAVARIQAFGMESGRGLRGGTFTSKSRGSTTLVTLHEVLWTNDLPVSGEIVYDAATGSVDASLRVTDGSFRIAWHSHQANAQATIAGTVAGRALHATMPAP